MKDRPLVYYCIALFIGCLSALLITNSLILDAVISASFFIIIWISDKKYIVLSTAFYIIGVISFLLYFNITLKDNYAYKIRITEKSNYYSVGNYLGRKINLQGSLTNVNEGEMITALGEFKKENDYEEGSIGTFKINEIEEENKDIISYICSYKEEVYKKFYWTLGEEDSGKVMALCFGDTSHLDMSDKNDLKTLGIVYIICVSGLHMLIVFKMLETFLNLKISIFAAVLYTIFTGCQPATVRALIMIVILKVSKKTYRNYDFLSSLSLAALILLFVKPYYILNVGFNLSFLATLGINLFYNKCLKIFYKLPRRINESLSVSISVQSISMPYMLLTLKNFSLSFLIGNLVLVPLYSAVIVIGTLALVLSHFTLIFNFICVVIGLFLTAAKGATNLLLKISIPLVYISTFNVLIILTLYICYMLIKKGYRMVKTIPAFLFLLVLLQFYSFYPQVDYVYLKSGNSIVIRYKFKSILLSSKDIEDIEEKRKALGELQVNNFVYTGNKDTNILLNNEYVVSVSKGNNHLEIKKVGSLAPLMILNGTTVKYKGINFSSSYDIINLENSERVSRKDLPKDAINFNIINGKIIAVKK